MNQHQKLKINHTTILNKTPVNNYIIQNPSYKEQIKCATALIKETKYILIGAGISTTARLTYNGKRFIDNFSEFIERYGTIYMKNTYIAGFYPFPTQEEKDYFVLTTNVDHQFYKSVFQTKRIFATQGDYGVKMPSLWRQYDYASAL